MFLRPESSAFKSQSCTKIVHANKILIVVVIIIISIIAVMDDAVSFCGLIKLRWPCEKDFGPVLRVKLSLKGFFL